MRNFSKALAILAMLESTPALAQDFPPLDEEQADRPQMALMGTIPIYWGDAADLGEIVRGEAQTHWARDVLEANVQPVALDYLTQEALAPFSMLMMAQPRGLTGEENVALDAWVRSGGRLLLFADPMMTAESRFGIGDRRRPQDVILLSPILTHWGLELWFDTEQEEGLVQFDPDGDNIPVNVAGAWIADETKEDCAVMRGRLIARCQLGEGEALLVADAAMLDLEGPHPGAREALAVLLQRTFPQFGEYAGMDPSNAPESRGNDRNLPENTAETHGEHHHGEGM